jgi:hypothetical protein
MDKLVSVGLMVSDLFVRVSVEAAVRGCGLEPEVLRSFHQVGRDHFPVVILDLQVPGLDAPAVVKELVSRGVHVLAFGPHVDSRALETIRQAGAVALPKSSFLRRLPELLALYREPSPPSPQ